MKPPLALALGGGLGLLLLALGARPAAAREPTMDTADWILKVIRSTSAHEGQFWSVQKNLDGNGLSYGILQWTQRGGALGGLLAALQAADPAAFAATFGPHAPALLAVTARASLEPVGGAVLWAEPWVGRFAAAGRLPVFQQAQIQHAARSEYMQAALRIARVLGVPTERGVALAFDRAVQQGPTGAEGPARRLLDWYNGAPERRPRHPNDVLAQYAWMCASRFRRTTPPEKSCFNNACTLRWELVTEENSAPQAGTDYSVRRVPVRGVWHVVTGPGVRWSLYDLVTKRSSAVLRDAGLGDVGLGDGVLA